MRICMVISVPMPPREGIGHYVWYLSRFLLSTNHAVQIVTRAERSKPPHEVMDGVPIWRPRFYPVYPFHVHLHGLFVQQLVGRLEGDVDLFHLHTPLPSPLRTRRPKVVTVHTPMRAEARAIPVKSLRSLLVRAQIPISIHLERKILADAAGVAAVAHSVANELAEYGLTPNRVAVLGNGVETDLFHPPQQEQRAQPAETYVFAAGRLDLRKGFEDLVAAMSVVADRFPHAQLYIAGSGPLEGQLRAQIAELKLGQVVRLLGHVDHSNMAQLHRKASIFAHPAHYEGLPTVLLEAMACGQAVVSTAVSGALDVVEDEVNALLVPPSSPADLARAICRLLGDAGLRARLGAAALSTVQKRFSWNIVGSKYLHWYETLLQDVCQ